MKLEKVTDGAVKRRYDDACGAAHGLEIVGERWALLVMRELMFGPKRFGDLRASLPGISANVLTQRLEGLEAAGVLKRAKLPPPASAQVYELTDWGYESEPIFQTLGRWAARSPHHDPTLPVSAASIMLSMRTMINAERAGNMTARIGFVTGGESFVADLRDGDLRIARGAAAGSDAVFSGPPEALAAALYSGQELSAIEAGGILSVSGDRAIAERYVTLFELPPKAAMA